jgi:tryptophan synthase beta chain
VHSVSAGLDYPGIGPEHSFWRDQQRVRYVSATDESALEAFAFCSRLEGIIPALETAHAIAHVCELAKTRAKDDVIVLNMSGRGDKDCYEVARLMGEKID